jgi:hypothetical protein
MSSLLAVTFGNSQFFLPPIRLILPCIHPLLKATFTTEFKASVLDGQPRQCKLRRIRSAPVTLAELWDWPEQATQVWHLRLRFVR